MLILMTKLKSHMINSWLNMPQCSHSFS